MASYVKTTNLNPVNESKTGFKKKQWTMPTALMFWIFAAGIAVVMCLDLFVWQKEKEEEFTFNFRFAIRPVLIIWFTYSALVWLPVSAVSICFSIDRSQIVLQFCTFPIAVFPLGCG